MALTRQTAGMRQSSLAWAGHAASAFAIAYAIVVRGYHWLGGTIGLAGTFEDPAAMRRASLVAGLGILLAGLGALALVRPWGLRLPRWLVIVPALAGSRDEAAQFAWDLLFYEPWFLGLGVLVTLATLHHHRRTGGSARAGRRLVAITVAATLVLTLFARTLVVARSG